MCFFGWFPQVQDKNKKHIIISIFFSPKKWHLDSTSDKFPYISTIRKIETRAHLKKSWNWTPTQKKITIKGQMPQKLYYHNTFATAAWVTMTHDHFMHPGSISSFL